MENKQIESQMLEFLNKKDQEKYAQEEQKRNMIKQMTESNVFQSAAEKIRQEAEQRERQKQE